MSWGEGTIRTCDWPGCPAFYDALAVMLGEASAAGWRLHKSFGLHMCGEHSPLVWGPEGGLHLASARSVHETGTCVCGAPLTPGGPTLGDLGAAYLLHVVEDAARRAA